MKEYYIDQNSIDKNYGLYDYLGLENNTKTLGCISSDKYLYHIDIADQCFKWKQLLVVLKNTNLNLLLDD